jgi:hypothetical protein
LWENLPRIEGAAVGSLTAFGSPPDGARTVVMRWQQNELENWRKSVERKLGLTLVTVRLAGRVLEVRFEGLMSEPMIDECPPVREQLDKILHGCMPLCS